MMRRAAVVAFVLAAAAPPGFAQQRPPAASTPAPAPVPETPLAYEPELLRLAEALGVIAYVSQLCAKPEAAEWSKRAQQIIDAEGGTSARRERLAGAYNRGFLGHQAMHRSCGDSARLVLELRRAEARRITLDISTRFGG
jgi:uncharacterized protein (TIGR02301 family)